MYNRNWKPGMSRTQHKTAGGIQNSDLDSLLSFAKSYASMGNAVQEQLYDLFMGNFDDINPNAVPVMVRALKGKNNELDLLFKEFQEWHTNYMGESIRLGSTRRSAGQRFKYEEGDESLLRYRSFQDMWNRLSRKSILDISDFELLKQDNRTSTITIEFTVKADYKSLMSGDPEELPGEAVSTELQNLVDEEFDGAVYFEEPTDVIVSRRGVECTFTAEVWLQDAVGF